MYATGGGGNCVDLSPFSNDQIGYIEEPAILSLFRKCAGKQSIFFYVIVSQKQGKQQ